LRDISVLNTRSRFLGKTVGTHTGSSIESPTNRRNRRLYWSWERSEPIEKRICTRLARRSRSHAIEGRPSPASRPHQIGVERDERCAHDDLGLAQRMARGNALLKVRVANK
jgi:hypothetical protein